MDYMLTLHILNVYFDQTQPHQFKYPLTYLPCMTSLQRSSSTRCCAGPWRISSTPLYRPSRIFSCLISPTRVTGEITTWNSTANQYAGRAARKNSASAMINFIVVLGMLKQFSLFPLTYFTSIGIYYVGCFTKFY